jgi:hypothetical protein
LVVEHKILGIQRCCFDHDQNLQRIEVVFEIKSLSPAETAMLALPSQSHYPPFLTIYFRGALHYVTNRGGILFSGRRPDREIVFQGDGWYWRLIGNVA